MSDYIGWLLTASDRARLMLEFPPAYPDVIAHHITFSTGKKATLPEASTFVIVGIADDLNGVQALVVAIDGKTARGDGRHFHITWSIDRSKGYKPVDSNKVIASEGWVPLPTPIRFSAEPFKSWEL